MSYLEENFPIFYLVFYCYGGKKCFKQKYNIYVYYSILLFTLANHAMAIAPTVTISAPDRNFTSSTPVNFTITYSGAYNINLDPDNVTLIKTGTVNGTVVVSGTNNTTITVTINNISGDGNFAISLPPGTATDLTGNASAGAAQALMLV